MPKDGRESVRSFVKKEFLEHPLSSLATLAVSLAGVSLATHYIEESYHDAKDWIHDRLERRHDDQISEVTEQPEDSKEHCDA
jgi:hypothetical protein